MPLLCISLLVLLLLPLSLSCNIPPLDEIRYDYETIVKTDLQKTSEDITTLLQNSNCPVLKNQPRSCSSGNASSVNILLALTCKMKNLLVPHQILYQNTSIEHLVKSLLNSMHCSCSEKPTKKPKANSKRRRAATRRRRDDRTKKETRKLCRAKAILSAMTECYEMLNSL